jgi:hypothetical protein
MSKRIYPLLLVKLEEKHEGWTPATKWTTFLDGIKVFDANYDVVIQHLRGTPNIMFQDAVQSIRQRKQELLKLWMQCDF